MISSYTDCHYSIFFIKFCESKNFIHEKGALITIFADYIAKLILKLNDNFVCVEAEKICLTKNLYLNWLKNNKVIAILVNFISPALDLPQRGPADTNRRPDWGYPFSLMS